MFGEASVLGGGPGGRKEQLPGFVHDEPVPHAARHDAHLTRFERCRLGFVAEVQDDLD